MQSVLETQVGANIADGYQDLSLRSCLRLSLVTVQGVSRPKRTFLIEHYFIEQ